MGRAYELSGSWSKAEETYKAMIAYAQSISASAMECQGLNSLAAVYYRLPNKVEQAVALLERALAIAEQSGHRRGMAKTVWNLAMAAYFSEELELALHHAEQALDLTRDLQHPQFMARHLSILAYIYLKQREWNKVEAYAAEASRLYTDSGKLVLADDSQRALGFGQILAGKPQEALATLQESAAFARQIENLWGEAECTWKLAYTWLELGDYGQAVRLAREGVQLTEKLGLQPMSSLALSVWGIVQRTLMVLDGARETFLEELLNAEDQHLIEVVLDWVLAELCAIHALAGDWPQAYEYARRRLQIREDESLLPMGLSGWYETEALLRNGDTNLARAEVARLEEIVGNNKRYRLILLRSQAVLAQRDGDMAQAIAYLEAALSLAQEMELPGEEWPILGVLGGLYATQGEQDKAQEAYGEAAVIIHRLAETIDEENLRTGFLAADQVRSVLEMSKRV